jgi:hypothetical protein
MRRGRRKSKKVVEALHKIVRLFRARVVFSKAVFALLICLFRRAEKENNIYVGLTGCRGCGIGLEMDVDVVNGKCDFYIFVP